MRVFVTIFSILFPCLHASLNDVILNKRQAIPNPTCECIPDASGNGCLQYDSRLQAMSLDEAMASFPDLTIQRDESNPDSTVESQVTCTTQECQDCNEDITIKLKQVGLIATTPNEILSRTGNTTCTKYSFSKDADNNDDDDDDSSNNNDSHEKRRAKKNHHKRQRRQAVGPIPTEATTVIGQRYTLSCSSKGVVADSNGLVSLCSSCWVWRKLPDTYSPQYINELICDTSDSACLSGYATCSIGFRSLDVIQTNGNIRTTVSISAGSYCECKISQSSSLLSLVTGNVTLNQLSQITPISG